MHDAIVIGSGFGGAMAAQRLVRAGWRVLLIERGGWVPRGPGRRDPLACYERTPHYSMESAYRCLAGGEASEIGSLFCVGGPSVFYGGASFRLREEDFKPGPDIVNGSRAAWPIRYPDLEPYYGEAEHILGVAGDDRDDPTRPPRRAPYTQQPPPLAPISRRFRDAALELGLHPFPIPLAINFSRHNGRPACDQCRQCDTYACALEAKNDTDVAIIAPLRERGLEVRANTAVTRLVESRGRVTEVIARDRVTGENVSFRGRQVLLAAGALATPHLLLASGLERLNPAGRAVGAYLMRHACAMVFGFCNDRPDPDRVFHKQVAIADYYRGDRAAGAGAPQRLGSIQQISTPPHVLIESRAPFPFRGVPLHGFVEHLAGALVIAEDEPRAENRVVVDWSEMDPIGLPRLEITRAYTPADEARRRGLVRRAKRILRGVGAWSFYTHEIETFSHALGTVRMGPDPAASPLDEWCRFRGIENLRVVDGSAMPTSGAVNPSLTIAALALRSADHLVREASA
jgi:choline dehydrogenase-like flavoprotein